MILADKIIENRKKNGWSQEELAEKLGVSRQSVSKWESAQAIPDMNKILQLSQIFGVSTDYLIKDEITEPSDQDLVDDGTQESVRKVSMEEAHRFLEYNEHAARTVSTGVMMCILSPTLLILLSGLADEGIIPYGTDVMAMCGVSILLIIVAIAVGIFIKESMDGKQYEYLEKVNIETEYGVTGLAKEKRDAYAPTHTRLLIMGIMLCIIAAVPMLMMISYTSIGSLPRALGVLSVDLLLGMIAVGVKMIVLTSMRQGGFDKLLEEGDYTRINKQADIYSGIYWSIATAIYLIWSFVTMNWQFTWIVWPIAGVLYAAYKEIFKLWIRSKNNQ